MNIAKSGKELINICQKEQISLSEYAIRKEVEAKGVSREELFLQMKNTLNAMKESATLGREKKVYSLSGLIGGDAYRLQQYSNSGKSLMGSGIVTAMAMAMSSSEVNGSMGKIVACPTAGSCGILPAAMASGAVVELMGGTPEMSLDAAAIIFKNVLGLVCDPVAGLVEIPCAKRNVSGAINALCTADLVMAGVNSKIPFDDALSAMYKVGLGMPAELRETALGGVAITETGLKLKEKVFGKTNN
ncbi:MULTISPECIES: L-serine ammonia-lyase, iron-sulfur-dependent, subunit alpha [unclassified Clostridium]|uniref:L-serine ammonia-lyase, iron-sulfur-dependent, subunit alpha n=1 Tax=Clostridium TaxID=1485 RepID=UPI001C8B4BB5|nr:MULTISPECIES: L-serine ammonia-lyase, iron-sulfur-dependent, subunit alpha [unclassified Clostridium]MBX9139153.1 L-serine ammonia-lyase, iron-sulfur-dependent, subunit alpha [Clostridium sp. K12(2020)]MBX9144881.1 L-serine ammonia-lyase, iron-sulfur-dependent, subunit alpha [Clostridium sp. K13]MDU2291357.1 L-serine ammonia-lyase, iron-sulfur-dependent, subunit alpha [Clostridium celatum]